MNVNTEEGEKEEKETSPLRNNEVNYDYSHREGLEGGEDPLKDERMTPDDYAAIQKSGDNDAAEKAEEKKSAVTPEEKKLLVGNKIKKSIVSLDEQLEEIYTFQEPDEAEHVINDMKNLVIKMFAEMQNIGAEYQKEEKFVEVMGAISKELRFYNKK